VRFDNIARPMGDAPKESRSAVLEIASMQIQSMAGV